VITDIPTNPLLICDPNQLLPHVVTRVN